MSENYSQPNTSATPSAGQYNRDPEASLHYFQVDGQVYRVVGSGDEGIANKELADHLGDRSAEPFAPPEWFLQQERRLVCTVPIIGWICDLDLSVEPNPDIVPPANRPDADVEPGVQLELFYPVLGRYGVGLRAYDFCKTG